MKVVAAIGTRELDRVIRVKKEEYQDKLQDLWNKGWYLHTGGSTGADHMAATIFSQPNEEGLVRGKLFLPWADFNKELVNGYGSLLDREVYDYRRDVEATNSVDIYHPFSKGLTVGARKLLARNYLIIYGADLVLALPDARNKGELKNMRGGTAQGIRIAQDLGKELVVL
jgi:hypothetical protein